MTGPSPVSLAAASAKSASLAHVFNPDADDDDDDDLTKRKKRKLQMLTYTEDEKRSAKINLYGQSLAISLPPLGSLKTLPATLAALNRTEDRTATLKALMDSIPTAPAPLFAHAVAWDSVDATFVEKRIQPWVTRKITEYLGEEEKTLVAFVCSKIAAKAKPQYVDPLLFIASCFFSRCLLLQGDFGGNQNGS